MMWNLLVYIHTYTHTYIHTHIHIYIHTYICVTSFVIDIIGKKKYGLDSGTLITYFVNWKMPQDYFNWPEQSQSNIENKGLYSSCTTWFGLYKISLGPLALSSVNAI